MSTASTAKGSCPDKKELEMKKFNHIIYNMQSVTQLFEAKQFKMINKNHSHIFTSF